jgi:hypothetical protein
MITLARTLITGTALTILLLSPACAGESSDGSVILNGQIDLHTSTSSLSTTIDNAGGGANVSSTAGGNAVNIVTMNDTHVDNSQYTSSVSIFSDLGAQVTNVNGDVNIQGQATCNDAEVSTDPNVTQVNSNQNCQAVDPNSSVYVDSWNVNGNFTANNLAAGNSFEEDTNAPNGPVNTIQTNASSINANTTVHVANVAGAVNVSGTAVGNTAEIVHYGTGN